MFSFTSMMCDCDMMNSLVEWQGPELRTEAVLVGVKKFHSWMVFIILVDNDYTVG